VFLVSKFNFYGPHTCVPFTHPPSPNTHISLLTLQRQRKQRREEGRRATNSLTERHGDVLEAQVAQHDGDAEDGREQAHLAGLRARAQRFDGEERAEGERKRQAAAGEHVAQRQKDGLPGFFPWG
jgi:hypothetical protein